MSDKIIPQKYLNRIGEINGLTIIIGFEYIPRRRDERKNQSYRLIVHTRCECGVEMMNKITLIKKYCPDCRKKFPKIKRIKKIQSISERIVPQKYLDRIGERNGITTIVRMEYSLRKDRPNSVVLHAIFLCDCGNISFVRPNQTIFSCKSCQKYEGHGTHYLTNSPEYRSWSGMKARCYNPNSEGFKYYGGRTDPGPITVCDRWLESFENFYADMGERPFPKEDYSIDRINNDDGYYKDNCKWSTMKEQINNQRAPTKTYMRVCEFCYKAYETKPGGHSRKYCTRSCRAKAFFKRNYIKKEKKNYNKICPGCQIAFNTNNLQRIYCTDKCQVTFHNKNARDKAKRLLG